MFVECPWCGGIIEIEQINCKIFRHGYFIKTNTQINPHLTQAQTDKILPDIWGCGGQFYYDGKNLIKYDESK